MASISKAKPERKAKAAPTQEVFSLISNEKLIAIYGAMVKCRMVEQRAAMLFQQGKLASDLHASSGREATAAAVAIDLVPGDSLILSGGDWLPAFVKGMPLESLFRALAPAAMQVGPGVLEPIHVLLAGDKAPELASIRDRAIAAQTANQQSIVAAILPSSELLLKRWHDVLAAAASQRLPIIFVHYADTGDQAGTEKTGRKSKNPRALFHGVPAITVDAQDAVAIYRVAYEAIMRARQGRGATLLECMTLAQAAVSGNAKKNEPISDPHRLPDPVATMEAYLKSKDIDPAQHNQRIVTSFNLEMDVATRFLDL